MDEQPENINPIELTIRSLLQAYNEGFNVSFSVKFENDKIVINLLNTERHNG